MYTIINCYCIFCFFTEAKLFDSQKNNSDNINYDLKILCNRLHWNQFISNRIIFFLSKVS